MDKRNFETSFSEIVPKAIAEDTNRSELVGRAIAQLFFYSMFDFSREAF